MSTEPEGAIQSRLRIIAKRMGGLEALAAATGTARRTLGNYLSGRNEPKLSFLLAVSSVGNVSLDWLIRGVEPEAGSSEPATTAEIDIELMGRVTDAIARLYKEMGASLAPVDLGRMAGERYSEIAAATADPDEQRAMIKLVVQQLKRDIQAAAAEPGTGKHVA